MANKAYDDAIAERDSARAANVALRQQVEDLQAELRGLVSHIETFHDDNHHGGHTEPFGDCAWDLCELAARALPVEEPTRRQSAESLLLEQDERMDAEREDAQ